MILFIFVLSLLGISPNPAFATHEADHRYVVSGYVRDAEGNALKGVDVLLEHKGGEKQKTTTNGFGYYEALFHLHDDNLGDEIIVTVGSEVKKAPVTFTPGDRVTHRGATIDFGAPGKESPYAWIYWTGGSAFLIAIVYFGFFRKKKKAKAIPRKKKR
ncbi:MAG: carboxypeptidase regulatory-like domain-containing protein [Nitrospirae bacterium]|nr:carboxypeptidase regulatory-like domain-containing protein [Candidatus Manganitrophaceae bacterium]